MAEQCPTCHAPSDKAHATGCPNAAPPAGVIPLAGAPVGVAAASLVPVPMGARGVVFQGFDELRSFGQEIVKAGFAPKGMNAAAVAIAIQGGLEFGMPGPMAALSNMAVINGRVGPVTKAAKAKIMSSGVLKPGTAIDEWTEGDGAELVGFIRSERRDWPQSKTDSFSMKEAVVAGYPEKNANYKKRPKSMLLARARSFHFDYNYGDVLLGYTVAEGLEDLPPVNQVAPGEFVIEPPTGPDPMLALPKPELEDPAGQPIIPSPASESESENPIDPEPQPEEPLPPLTPEQIAARGPVEAYPMPADSPPSGVGADNYRPGDNVVSPEEDGDGLTADQRQVAKRKAAAKKGAETRARKKAAAEEPSPEPGTTAAGPPDDAGRTLTEVEVHQVRAAITRRALRFANEGMAAERIEKLIVKKAAVASLAEVPVRILDPVLDFAASCTPNMAE